jgi:hypothetical protein
MHWPSLSQAASKTSTFEMRVYHVFLSMKSLGSLPSSSFVHLLQSEERLNELVIDGLIIIDTMRQ